MLNKLDFGLAICTMMHTSVNIEIAKNMVVQRRIQEPVDQTVWSYNTLVWHSTHNSYEWS
jgi:hypothetical protein